MIHPDKNPDYGFPDQPIPEQLPAFYEIPLEEMSLQDPPPTMVTYIKSNLFEDFGFFAKAIEAGLEYTQECLCRHDQELGRTTRKNESWAQIMEQDIEKMKQALERIKKYENQ